MPTYNQMTRALQQDPDPRNKRKEEEAADKQRAFQKHGRPSKEEKQGPAQQAGEARAKAKRLPVPHRESDKVARWTEVGDRSNVELWRKQGEMLAAVNRLIDGNIKKADDGEYSRPMACAAA